MDEKRGTVAGRDSWIVAITTAVMRCLVFSMRSAVNGICTIAFSGMNGQMIQRAAARLGCLGARMMVN
jgi:hypothetical protein